MWRMPNGVLAESRHPRSADKALRNTKIFRGLSGPAGPTRLLAPTPGRSLPSLTITPRRVPVDNRIVAPLTSHCRRPPAGKCAGLASVEAGSLINFPRPRNVSPRGLSYGCARSLQAAPEVRFKTHKNWSRGYCAGSGDRVWGPPPVEASIAWMSHARQPSPAGQGQGLQGMAADALSEAIAGCRGAVCELPQPAGSRCPKLAIVAPRPAPTVSGAIVPVRLFPPLRLEGGGPGRSRPCSPSLSQASD